MRLVLPMRVDPRLLGPLAGLTALAAGLVSFAGVSTTGFAASTPSRSVTSPAAPDRREPMVPQAPLRAAPPAPAEVPVEVPIRRMAPGLTESDVAALLRNDPAALGSLSIGKPNHGALLNGRQMPDAPYWHVVEPARAWGTDETIASIARAVARVRAEFPDTPELYVGNLSSQTGGYLRPHRSHQSGRDADLGYFYVGGAGWYARANAANLDRARTWALVNAFSEDPNVEAIFMDRSVQRLLREYAGAHGVSPARLDGLFARHRLDDHLIHHEWGHLTHLHVRFKSPSASEAGELARRPFEAWRRSLPRAPAVRRRSPPASRQASSVSRARPRSPS